jgi:hypothetical protein
MSNIRAEIEAAAKVFAASVFQILRKHSIDELVSEGQSAEGRRVTPAGGPAPTPSRGAAKSAKKTAPSKGKRGASKPLKQEDVSALAHRVVDFVAKKGSSGRKGILDGLGVPGDALQKALAYARGHGALGLEGEKRNAVYVVTGRALP